jgi:hypothetical protein
MGANERMIARPVSFAWVMLGISIGPSVFLDGVRVGVGVFWRRSLIRRERREMRRVIIMRVLVIFVEMEVVSCF